MEIWVTKDIRRRRFEVSLSVVTNGVDALAMPLTFTVPDDGAVVEPTIMLSFEDATTFMTELWRAGVRPQEVGTSGELAAVKYHLEDMRNLVFKNVTK